MSGEAAAPRDGRRADLHAVLAGVVASVVGFASTFALVLAGLRAVGATEAEAASGLFALCLTMGAAAVVLGLRHRLPITIAWSTPGAALLISAGAVEGGFAAAVGAFVVCGALIVLAGLWRPLGRWIGAIPAPLASAMLAGVLLPVCLAPVRAVADIPELALAPVVVWLLLTRFARPWAVPAALAVTAVVLWLDGASLAGARLAPSVEPVAPAFERQALLSLALPLFIVTMASQNVTGMGVLASFGFRAPLRPILAGTGAATIVGAPFGGHAVNLAAITAALAAGPDAHPDPGRRWIASVSGGATYVVLALGAGLAGALLTASPPLLVEAVAGLALLGALGAALTGAAADPDRREAAVVTFVVSASGVTIAGISAPFWGLLAGLLVLALHHRPAAAGGGG